MILLKISKWQGLFKMVEKKLVFVLGMHRSGTSALTGVLAKLGMELPKTLMEAHEINPKGFFESVEIMKINNELLASQGSSWRDVRPLMLQTTPEVKARIAHVLETEYGASSLIILKDPRICRMVPAWVAAGSDLKYTPYFILPYRHPLEVARSLERRDAMPIVEGILLWLRYVVDAEFETRNMSRAFVSMTDLLDDWRTAIAGISRRIQIEWPILPETVAPEIDAFLDSGLRHHTVGDDHELASLLEGWTQEVFTAIQALEKTETPSAYAVLDKVRQDMDAACQLFGPALSGRIERVGVLERAYQARNQDLSKLNANMEKITSEHATLSEVARLSQEEKKVLTEQLHLSHEIRGRISSERDHAVSEKQQLQQQYNEDIKNRETLIHDLKDQLQQSAILSAQEIARLIVERDNALAGLRLADERHRTAVRKAMRNSAVMQQRIENVISNAAIESARLMAEKELLTVQIAQLKAGHESRLAQMYDAQLASAEIIGRQKTSLSRMEQAVAEHSALKMQVDAQLKVLAGELQAMTIDRNEHARLLNSYRNAARVHFLAWALNKGLRPS